MVEGNPEIPVERRDFDRSEREFTRIEPVIIFTYASVALLIVDIVIFPFPGNRYRVPNWTMILGATALTALAAVCLNRMSRPLAWVMTLAPILKIAVSILVPAVAIMQAYFTFWSHSTSLSMDPYEFRDAEPTVWSSLLQSPRNYQILPSAVISLVVYYTLWRGWVRVAFLPSADRQLLKSLQAMYASKSLALLSYLGVPAVVSFMGRRGILIAALFFLSALSIGFGLHLTIDALTLDGYTSEWSAANVQCRQDALEWNRQIMAGRPSGIRAEELAAAGFKMDDDIFKCTRDALDKSFAEFYMTIGLVLVCFVVGNVLLRVARKRIRLSANRLLDTDTRPPILFLRSFRDDQVVLRASPRRTWLGRVLALWQPRQPLDHLLLEEGTARGPVVALGNPHDRFPPYGISRGYFDNKTWQQAVEDLARNAQAIVICLDDTEGIWWEVEHIGRNLHHGKTLFLFPPGAVSQDMHSLIAGKLIEKLSEGEEALRQLGMRLTASIGSGHVLGFYLDPSDTLRMGTTSTYSRDTYMLMLRWFLREQMTYQTLASG